MRCPWSVLPLELDMFGSGTGGWLNWNVQTRHRQECRCHIFAIILWRPRDIDHGSGG